MEKTPMNEMIEAKFLYVESREKVRRFIFERRLAELKSLYTSEYNEENPDYNMLLSGLDILGERLK